MKCPKCGAGGAEFEYFSWIIDKWVVQFTCDKDPNHHFLIVRLVGTLVDATGGIVRQPAAEEA